MGGTRITGNTLFIPSFSFPVCVMGDDCAGLGGWHHLVTMTKMTELKIDGDICKLLQLPSEYCLRPLQEKFTYVRDMRPIEQLISGIVPSNKVSDEVYGSLSMICMFLKCLPPFNPPPLGEVEVTAEGRYHG